jgi:hypothetical protein
MRNHSTRPASHQLKIRTWQGGLSGPVALLMAVRKHQPPLSPWQKRLFWI